MADQTTNPSQLEDVTKELYKKNLELVNANKEMTLLQKLYESMAVKLNVEELTQDFIQTIVENLELQGGLVVFRKPNTHYLQNIATYFSNNNVELDKYFHIKSSQNVSTTNKTNILSQALHEQKKLETKDMAKVLSALVGVEKTKTISDLGDLRSALVFPLGFGTHFFAVMTIFLKTETKELSAFEKSVLDHVSTVFGVALDRVMIYQDLKSANKKLKMLDQLKDEFVSVASHELRTPLTAIKGYLWLAINKSPTPLPEEVSKNLKIAHDSSERLSRMVEDMLTISRIEGKRLKLETTQFDIMELTQEVYNELAIRATTKKIHFTFDKIAQPVLLNGDKERLREVITNIVGNALKFTPEEGTINIKPTVDQHSIVFRITDTGPGIAKEDIPKLFQKFVRLSHSYEKTKESGTGLGLYVSKQIIDLHGGKVQIESELGKGTTFIVTLPLETPLSLPKLP